MNPNPVRTLLALVCAALLTALPALAQSATGTITGRVFNPATGEYLRNAQVRIVDSGDSVVSEDEGLYRLSPVPAGRVTVEVSYTGYRKVTATVDVAALVEAVRELSPQYHETAEAEAP